MRSYPIPADSWVRNHLQKQVDDVDLIVGFLPVFRDDVRFSSIFNDIDNYDMSGTDKNLLDSTFRTLLSYLHMNWDEVHNPMGALEHLVTDFRASRAIWDGDGNLPASVAGIGALIEMDPNGFADASRRYRTLLDRYVPRSGDGESRALPT